MKIEKDYTGEELEKICQNLDGTVDLFLIMDGADLIEDVFDRRLPDHLNFNKVRFTPRSSLKYPNGERKQKVEGNWEVSRYALIADEGWCRGNSLREVTNWLVNQGYSQEKIYSIYGCGANPALPKNHKFERALGGRADNVLNAIKAINRKYEGKSFRKGWLSKRYLRSNKIRTNYGKNI